MVAESGRYEGFVSAMAVHMPKVRRRGSSRKSSQKVCIPLIYLITNDPFLLISC